MSQQIGALAEAEVKDYLTKQGLRWLMSNYRCRWGEIDLIMADGKTIVFVEVRARTSIEYGGPIESITLQKRKKLLKTATHFLVCKNYYNTHSARFDVVGLQGSSHQILWLKNAFGLDF